MESRRPNIPRLVRGVDLRTLPLTPVEGFVLSRIDGSATLADLADLTNLDGDEVDRVIRKLLDLGAVEWADGQTALPRPSTRPPAPTPVETTPVAVPSPPTPAPAPSIAPAPSTTPFPSEGEIDLPLERRERIDDLYARLETLDHYAALNLRYDADAKAIRSAYFDLSKVFHPDTAFRKNIGPYKARMEAIFKRLTEAYDVLGKKKSRTEYDAYLELQGVTRAVEEAIATPPPPPPESSTTSAPTPEPSEPRAMSEEGKRRARELMAMRMSNMRNSQSRTLTAATGSVPPTAQPNPASSSSNPPRGREGVLRDLTSSLKGAASHTGGVEGAQRHYLEGKRHEQQGDLASAAREMRLAMALAPDREDVRAEQQRIARLLAAQLADKYQQQADYEERHKKWAAAAISWSKVCEGRPDEFEPAWRAAHALLEAKGDLRQAQRLAQRACDLAPNDVTARRTLGRVYLAAGLQLNARRELERAGQLDPHDETVKTLLRELK